MTATASDHRGSRVFFVLVGAPVTALLIAVTTLGIVGTLARQTESTALSFTQPISKIRIDIGQGSVTLRGGETGAVTGERVLTRGLQTPAHHERVEGDVLVITAGCNPIGNTWCDITYVLDVPRSIDVVVETGFGSIRASGLSSTVDLRAGAGSVTVEELSGAANLESGAGSVTGTGLASPTVTASSGAGSVELAFSASPERVDASAGAGSVDIEVPRDGTTYRVDEAESDLSIRVAVPTDPAATNVLRVASGAGQVTIHHPEA